MSAVDVRETASCAAMLRACEVCQLAESTSAYFKMAFADPHHLAATSEGIADTLGFCQRHGAELLGCALPERATAEVFARVADLVMPLLEPSRFGEEKFQQVYFSAAWACPACAFERRAAGRHAARLVRQHFDADQRNPFSNSPQLCVDHFQLLARTLKPESRMPALALQCDTLDLAARALDRLSSGTLRTAMTAGTEPALKRALALVGAARGGPSASPSAALAAALQACDTFEQALGWDGACPVCVEVERARQRWLLAVPLAVAHELDDWLFLPTCAEHVAIVAEHSDIALTARVTAHALRVASEQIHQQLRVLVRAAQTEQELAAARIARWGRRSRRRNAVPPKAPAPKLVRCAACERLAIAQLQATNRLLRLLQQGRQRELFQAGWGLCMKHHAQAYLMAPKGVVRTLLAADQARRLSEFLRQLKEPATPATPVRTEAGHAPMLGYVAELRRFCGFG